VRVEHEQCGVRVDAAHAAVAAQRHGVLTADHDPKTREGHSLFHRGCDRVETRGEVVGDDVSEVEQRQVLEVGVEHGAIRLERLRELADGGGSFGGTGAERLSRVEGSTEEGGGDRKYDGVGRGVGEREGRRRRCERRRGYRLAHRSTIPRRTSAY
jgi:hypothetical protein